MDLIGLPYQLVIGPRGLDKGVVELKTRQNGARQELSPDAAVTLLGGK
jgi:prolyl-tRNA synthetase